MPLNGTLETQQLCCRFTFQWRMIAHQFLWAGLGINAYFWKSAPCNGRCHPKVGGHLSPGTIWHELSLSPWWPAVAVLPGLRGLAWPPTFLISALRSLICAWLAYVSTFASQLTWQGHSKTRLTRTSGILQSATEEAVNHQEQAGINSWETQLTSLSEKLPWKLS